jgi:phosphopantothenoylcysteine decarboxylase
VVALPFTNRAHAAHPTFVENVERLRSWGIRGLFGPDTYPLHEPGTGSNFLHLYPWTMSLEALNERQ